MRDMFRNRERWTKNRQPRRMTNGYGKRRILALGLFRPHTRRALKPATLNRARKRGGLLVPRYGEGAYVWAALALYRHLPSSVPGAYRILAHLVSLSRNAAWTAEQTITGQK